MKAKNYLPALLVALFGIASLEAETNNVPARTSPSQVPNIIPIPFQVTAVESSTTREINDITNKALMFLTAKDYDRLDQLADALRSSKESWPNGSWKVSNVYAAFTPSDQAPETEWRTRDSTLRDWVAADQKSANARTALAYFLVDYAWRARGGGWADTVTDDGWRLMEERLESAVQVVDKSHELGLVCPVSWSVLLKCALGLNYERSDYNAIFDKAIHFAPDFKAYYVRRAFYLLPRWHGQPGEWESDLTASADRIGGEKGDELYAQVVWCVHQGVSFKNIFKENSLSWERVDRGFEVIEKDYPDSLDAKNERAHLAVLAHDAPKARKYFNQTGGKVDLTQWDSLNQYLRSALWAYNH